MKVVPCPLAVFIVFCHFERALREMAWLKVRSRDFREIACAPLLFTFSDRAKLKVILSLLHLCAFVLLFGLSGGNFRYVKVPHLRLVIASLFTFFVLTIAEFHFECRLFALLCLLGISGLIHLHYFLFNDLTLILDRISCHPVCLT